MRRKAKALLRPVPRLRRRLLEQIGRQTRPVHDRPRVDMLAIDGAVEALDQPVASGHIRHERDDVDAELWRPVTPKRLEDGYGVDPPHANATLTQRNVALDPPRERPDDLLGVWRAPSLDADEDARPLTPHVVEALGQQVPLVVGEPVRSGEPAGPRDGGTASASGKPPARLLGASKSISAEMLGFHLHGHNLNHTPSLTMRRRRPRRTPPRMPLADGRRRAGA